MGWSGGIFTVIVFHALGLVNLRLLSMIQDIKELILKIVNADRLGGRVETLNRTHLVLYDCMSWDCSCTNALLSRFPEVKISFRASRQSLSGFIVTFHVQRCTRGEAVWLLFIGLFLACCVFLLLRSPWWTKAIARI
jgi:hypothetical protein